MESNGGYKQTVSSCAMTIIFWMPPTNEIISLSAKFYYFNTIINTDNNHNPELSSIHPIIYSLNHFTFLFSH